MLIAVGKIVKAFGIHGDVVIAPMTDDLRRFTRLQRVFVGRDEHAVIETQVSRVVLEGRGVRVQLTDHPTRTEAERLVGALLFVAESDAVKPEPGSYFIHDLIGLRVIDTNGNDVGMLTDVLKYPASDVYVIDRQGSEVMIPAVKDFIKNIDLDRRTMTVHLIDGFLSEPEEVDE
ncbi:MAG: 16S rRNA processing protein RimM [Ignavibacteria bacterium]